MSEKTTKYPFVSEGEMMFGKKVRAKSMDFLGFKDLFTKKVFITSQNHCYTVNESNIEKNLKITHKSLFDGTIQGIQHISGNFFSFQGHPEASPGPQESDYLFDKFINIMKKIKFTNA